MDSDATTHDVEDNPLWQPLQLAMSSPYDDATEVLEILQQHGFDGYSEADKLEFLSNTPSAYWEFPKARRVILRSVIMRDNARILASLLPKIPLSFCQLSHAQELPYHEEARQILAANKCSWRSTNVKCQCKSHSEPSSDAENVCAMTRKASIYLAADLFLRACEHLSGKCILYLLSVCPEILTVSMSADCARFVAKAIIRIPELGDLFLNPQILQMARNNIGAITYWVMCNCFDVFFWDLYRSSDEDKTLYSYLHVFLTIAGGLFKHDIVRYRDAEGCSLLHVVCESMELRCWQCKYRLDLIRHLLLLGFDPAVTNNAGLTVPDILFGHLCNSMPSYDQPWYDDCDRNQYIVQTFLLYVHTVLPYVQNEAVRNIALPQVCFKQSPNFVANFNNIWNVFLDVNLFPQSTVRNIGLVFGPGRAITKQTSTSLPSRVLREMRKGLDPLVTFYASYDTHTYTYGDEHTLIEMAFRNIKFSYDPDDQRQHLVISPQWEECDSWSIMELLVYSGASIGRLKPRDLLDGLLHGSGVFSMLGGGIVPRLIRMLWMCEPTSKPDVITFLDRLAESTYVAHQSTAAELLPLVRSRPPLNMICRNAIARGIRQPDLRRLALPLIISREYLQFGDLPDDHPLKGDIE